MAFMVIFFFFYISQILRLTDSRAENFLLLGRGKKFSPDAPAALGTPALHGRSWMHPTKKCFRNILQKFS